MPAWFSPEDLEEKLSQDEEQALERLAEEELGYLKLRPYQEQAIQAVERGIREGRREMLLAMATGTGKTRTAIGLIYRLIKSKTCRRILFLVDRNALGEQAENAFKESPLENYRTFAQIFELQGLQEKVPQPETKVHIQTVQGMVSRLFKSGGEAGVPSSASTTASSWTRLTGVTSWTKRWERWSFSSGIRRNTSASTGGSWITSMRSRLD